MPVSTRAGTKPYSVFAATQKFWFYVQPTLRVFTLVDRVIMQVTKVRAGTMAVSTRISTVS